VISALCRDFGFELLGGLGEFLYALVDADVPSQTKPAPSPSCQPRFLRCRGYRRHRALRTRPVTTFRDRALSALSIVHASHPSISLSSMSTSVTVEIFVGNPPRRRTCPRSGPLEDLCIGAALGDASAGHLFTSLALPFIGTGSSTRSRSWIIFRVEGVLAMCFVGASLRHSNARRRRARCATTRNPQDSDRRSLFSSARSAPYLTSASAFRSSRAVLPRSFRVVSWPARHGENHACDRRLYFQNVEPWLRAFLGVPRTATSIGSHFPLGTWGRSPTRRRHIIDVGLLAQWSR